MIKRILLALLMAGPVWAGTYTTNMGLYKPTDGETGWGEFVRDNYDIIDSSSAILPIDLTTDVTGVLPSSSMDPDTAYTNVQNVFTDENNFQTITASSVSISGPVNISGLTANQCVQTTTNGLLTTSGAACGGSSGSSTLAVNKNGVQVTSPTIAINALSPPFLVTAVGGGTTAQWTLDPSSVTLQGQNVINLQGTLQTGATFYVSSGAVSGQLTANKVVASTLSISGSGIINILRVTGSGGLTVDNLTSGQCVQAGTAGLLTVTGSACGSGGGGSSSLQVTESGVEKTSPTASMNFFGLDFDLTAVGSTSTIRLSPSTTNYIQNTLSPSTTSQKFSVQISSVSEFAYMLAGSTIATQGTQPFYMYGPNIAVDGSLLKLSGAADFSSQEGVEITARGISFKQVIAGPSSERYIGIDGSKTNGLRFQTGTETLCSDLATGCWTSPTIGWNGPSTPATSNTTFLINGGGSVIIGGTSNRNAKLNIAGASLFGASLYTDIGAMPTNGIRVMGESITHSTVTIISAAASTYDLYVASAHWASAGPSTIPHLTVSTNGIVNMSRNFSATTSSVAIAGSGGLGVTYGATVGSMTVSNLTSGQCVQAGTGGLLTVTGSACGSGSGGASSLAVATGTSSGFSSVASSPTAIVNFNNAQFAASLKGGATAFVELLASSVTLQGNTNVGLLNADQTWTGLNTYSKTITANLGVAGSTMNFTSFNTTTTSATVTGSAGLLVMSTVTIQLPAASNDILVASVTLPSTLSAATQGVFIDVVGAGSSNVNVGALRVNLDSGFTGNGTLTQNAAIFATNASSIAATITNRTSAGIVGQATGLGTGTQIGVVGNSAQSAGTNIGMNGKAINATNSPTTNMGFYGMAGNGVTNNIAGYFMLRTDHNIPTTLGNAALIADNGAIASNIFEARDNATAVLTVADGGATAIAPTAATQDALSVVATLPGGVAANIAGVKYTITGAGSAAFPQRALTSQLSAGYSGSNPNAGGHFINLSTGTGANIGAHAHSSGVGASGANIGVHGSAFNGTNVLVGGYFDLTDLASIVVPTTSTALLADNGSKASDIFRAQDNAVSVFTIADGGGVTATSSMSVQGAAGFTVTYGATVGSMTVSNLTSGQCVQAGAGGLLTVSGAACGSGSGSGYALEPATVTIQANKGITASTGTFYTTTSSTEAFIIKDAAGISAFRFNNTTLVSTDTIFTVIGSTGAFGVVGFSTSSAGPFSLSVSSTNHVNTKTPSPALSSCGSSPSVLGSDFAFTITGGATSNGCTATFAIPFVAVPTCSVSQQTMSLVNALSYTVSATALTVTQTGLGTGKIDVVCIGHD